jgi:hypothetical protein
MWYSTASQESGNVRRIIVQAAIFLLAGVVVNVAVSWGLWQCAPALPG